MRRILFITILLGCFQYTQAQQTFTDFETLDVNNTRATLGVHGALWMDSVVPGVNVEFPKGSGKLIASGGSIWVSGYDAQNQLHVSAQTYRQGGNDYWPGPIENNTQVPYSTSQNWARIWKISYTDIQLFTTQPTHTITNTPTAILEWPAKGNPYAKGKNNVALTITTDMAPFVDVNSDGLYNPLNGDYPLLKGDQMLFWVFNDFGNTHTSTNGVGLKIEVHGMAYAYHRGSVADNIQFYEYTVENKSGVNYDSFRVAVWADMDLGYALDDYVGFDSSHRLGVCYNATNNDGTGQPLAYGSSMPMAGITVLRMPGETCQPTIPAGSFSYYNNDGSICGNPTLPEQYNNLMHSRYCPTPFSPNTQYAFPGDPGSTTWAVSECHLNNLNGDRRFVISSGDMTFTNGASTSIAFALVTTNPSVNNSCPYAGFSGIKIIADTAAKLFCSPLSAGITQAYVHNFAQVYPNPAQDQLHVKNSLSGALIELADITGRTLKRQPLTDNSTTLIDISSFQPGMYIYRILKNNAVLQQGKTVKE